MAALLTAAILAQGWGPCGLWPRSGQGFAHHSQRQCCDRKPGVESGLTRSVSARVRNKRSKSTSSGVRHTHVYIIAYVKKEKTTFVIVLTQFTLLQGGRGRGARLGFSTLLSAAYGRESPHRVSHTNISSADRWRVTEEPHTSSQIVSPVG